MNATKPPGFFATARNLFSGVSNTAVTTLRLAEDATATARLALIPMQVESLAEAQESLTEAKLTFEQFSALKADLLK
jgi:hypothetical protein